MCGSGTSCVAAFDNNRRFIGIDICAEYCDLSKERIEKHIHDVGIFNSLNIAVDL